jgi:hypothetical protein
MIPGGRYNAAQLREYGLTDPYNPPKGWKRALLKGWNPNTLRPYDDEVSA